jgi:hypothetical protein
VVWIDLERWLSNPGDLLADLESLADETGRRAADDLERATLERVLSDCAAKRERIQRAYIAGDMTDAERTRYLAAAERERRAASEGIIRLDATAAADVAPPVDLLPELAARLQAGIDLGTQQELVRILVKQILVETTPAPGGKKAARLLVTYRFPNMLPNLGVVPMYADIRE